MLVGYNTNVPYKGNMYHIQTEDSGLRNPVITTLLYFQGAILASKKINYAHIAAVPDYREKVRELMKEQHKAMIRELISGRHTGDGEASSGGPDSSKKKEGPPGGAPSASAVRRSMDDLLLDHIIQERE